MEDAAPRTDMEHLFRGPGLIARISSGGPSKHLAHHLSTSDGAFDREFPKRKLHHQCPPPVCCSIVVSGTFWQR